MRLPIDRTLLPHGFGSARFVLLVALLATVPVHASADGDSGSPGPLDHLVNVREGQRFSVVLHITSPGVDYPLALEWRTEGYTGNVAANAGESFRSSNGTSWYDFTDGDRVCSFCMKAYTKSAGRRMTQGGRTEMPCAWLDDYPPVR